VTVLAKITSSRAIARWAVVGLALGLSALTGLALWSTVSTERTTAAAGRLDRTSAVWGQVLLHVSVENEALTDYLRASSTVGRQPLVSALGSAGSDLAWLAQHGSPTEIRQVVAVQATYRTYTDSLRLVIAAGNRGNKTLVALLADQAALVASSLRKQVVANALRQHEEMTGYLTLVRRQNHQLRAAAVAISSFDLLLVVVCGTVVLTYQRRVERQAVDSRHRSLHDSLTGIANRVLLADRIEEALQATGRRGGSVALLLLDLDRFKEINDTLGHHHGDLLLEQVAARLSAVARDGDTVARLGGDEFAVLLPDVGCAQDAMAVADRMLSAVVSPAVLEGIVVDVSASIGVSVHPLPSKTASELLQHADIAMYNAKRGHHGTAMYDPLDDRRSSDQLTLLSELRQAVHSDQLVLHYQPKLRTDTGMVCGVEALVRWRHPRLGLLPPADFIGLAEQSDLIQPLTERVLELALQQHRAWQRDGLLLPVAVNIGTRSLLDGGLPDRVAALLAKYKTTPGQLTLEITESAVITDPARAAAVLGALRDIGVRRSVDDFGTGYSSMAYLQSLPLSELKIDKRFITEMGSSASSTAIVLAVLALARALELEAVAEGVEDEATWQALSAAGCDVAQGYHMSRPLPAAELAAWLADRSVPAAGAAAMAAR
jgi:diguanylate cyclase (GGDEF)-like protein